MNLRHRIEKLETALGSGSARGSVLRHVVNERAPEDRQARIAAIEATSPKGATNIIRVIFRPGEV